MEHVSTTQESGDHPVVAMVILYHKLQVEELQHAMATMATKADVLTVNQNLPSSG